MWGQQIKSLPFRIFLQCLYKNYDALAKTGASLFIWLLYVANIIIAYYYNSVQKNGQKKWPEKMARKGPENRKSVEKRVGESAVFLCLLHLKILSFENLL